MSAVSIRKHNEDHQMMILGGMMVKPGWSNQNGQAAEPVSIFEELALRDVFRFTARFLGFATVFVIAATVEAALDFQSATGVTFFFRPLFFGTAAISACAGCAEMR
jgi:hypothetical protein